MKGFTLVELMLSITVMFIGVIAIYGLLSLVIDETAKSTDRFIASQLAREGVELVRNIRDRNLVQATDWLTDMEDCNTGCEIDHDDPFPSLDASRFLKKDAQGFFNYEAGEDTKYKRRIIIAQVADYARVEVEVSWPSNSFVIEEHFYDWR